jgi:hypothetical protein
MANRPAAPRHAAAHAQRLADPAIDSVRADAAGGQNLSSI